MVTPEISPSSIEIGLRLRMLRHERGMKQKIVAANAGLTAPQLSKIESGKVDPKWSTISRIVLAIGVEWGEVITNHDRR